MCEAFPALTPWQAREGLKNDPDHLVLTIMEMRAFAAAKAHYAEKGDKGVPKSLRRLVELVKEIDVADMKAALAAKQAELDAAAGTGPPEGQG